MADPTRYTPGFNYSGWEADHPTEPKPGAELDNDFALIRHSIDETIRALRDVRRSDGQIQNASVDFDALSPAVKAAIANSDFDYEVIDDLLAKDANLSDLPDKPEAVENLGGPFLIAGENFSDVDDPALAVNNLGGPFSPFDTADAVAAAFVPSAKRFLETAGWDAPGDGRRTLLRKVESEPSHAGAVRSEDGAWWEDVGYATVVARIPSQFPTLQAAIDHYSRLPMRQGSRVDLLIEAGHAPEVGVAVSDGDYRHFWIRSEDSVVTVGSGFSGYFIRGTRAAAPTLDCLVDMDGKGSHGVELNVGPSSIHVTAGSGCINSGFHGLECRASHVSGNGSIWTGARDTGVRVQQGSIVRFNDADASDCGFRGFYVSRGSVAQLMDSRARNCGHGEASGQSGGYVVRRCLVALTNTGEGLTVDASGSTNGLWATRGAVVTADGGNFSGCEYGVRANDCAIVNVRDADVSGCTVRALQAIRASTINADGADLEGTGGTLDVEIGTGSTVNLTGATTRGGPTGSPHPDWVSTGKFNTVTPIGIAYDSARPDVPENEGYRTRQVTLANNSATYIVPPHTIGAGGQSYLVAYAAEAANPGGGLIWARGTNPSAANIAGGHEQVVVTTGVLDGTTGDPGSFTFSAATGSTGQGTQSRFYLENRTGSEVTISLTFLSPIIA